MNLKVDLILILFIFAGINLTAQNPYIKHYTTGDGLPSNVVYQVFQDSKDFIWFATDAGVARYDGSQFKYYNKKNGLGSNEIVKIKEDSFGRIWFFSLNGKLNFILHDTIFNATNAPFLDSLRSSGFFRNFFQDDDHTIYFYYNGLRDIFRLDSQNNVTKYKMPSIISIDTLVPHPYEGMLIRYLNKSPTGEFQLWTISGLYKLKALTEKPSLISDKNQIWEVYPIDNHTFYAIFGVISSTASTFGKVTQSNYEFTELPMDLFNFPNLPLLKPMITSIVEDTKGFLWVSTFDKGIFCLKNNQIVYHLDIDEGQAILHDNENNIWISSMSEGVYKLSPYLIMHQHHDIVNFGQKGIKALARDSEYGIWCTNGKTAYLYRDSSYYKLKFSREQGSFNNILKLKNNTLLIWEKGSLLHSIKNIQFDTNKNELSYDSITTSNTAIKKIISSATEDELFCSDYKTIFSYNHNKSTMHYDLVDIPDRIYNIFFNSKDELIINSNKNYIYNNRTIEVCEELSYFNDKIITDHLILNDTTELINIEGDSLYLYTSNNTCNLTNAFYFSPNGQIRNTEYDGSRLYLATSNQIYTCDNPLGLLNNKPVFLQPIDIIFKDIHDILYNDHFLYVASDDGLTTIPDTAINTTRNKLPIPYFISIQVNDKETDKELNLLTLRGKNRIKLVFGSKSYSSCPIIYSYMLEGQDKNWISGNGTNVVYQSIPRGEYVFKVRARKTTSEWSQPIEYRITVNATMWQHPLFFVTLSILIAILVTLIIIRRKNNQMKRQDMDHQLVTLEQKALQSMMNPHFIFNALSSIQSYLLQNKSREAGLYLSQFARLIRQNLSAINSPMVILEEEIDRLKNYLELEQLRMSDRFNYNIEIDENVSEDEIMIPSMILQPFVENAILHGISSLDTMGEIQIVISMDSRAALAIVIEDNGIGMKSSGAHSKRNEKHLHLGMEITRKRLKVIGRKFHVDTSIDITEASPDKVNPGTRVRIVVPIAYSGSTFK